MKWTRRRFLLLAASGAAAVGGAVLLGQVGGYSIDEETRRKLRVLSAKQFVILAAAARRILAPDGLPAPSSDEIGVPAYVDGWLAEAAPDMQRDFGRLLGVIEHGTPLWSGRRRRFTDLTTAQQDAHLETLGRSSISTLREGIGALKSLCMLGYYRDPRTWPICGYDGPSVPPGWTGGEDGP
jgi:gluconate 2-dehydrogenase subunit 3-like protein